jgi:hypothetical protein
MTDPRLERVHVVCEQLRHAKLFSRVGMELAAEDVARVSTWSEAVDQAIASEDARHEAAQDLGGRIRSARPAEYEDWNKIVVPTRAVYVEHLEPSIVATLAAHGAEGAASAVRWLVVNGFMEKAYSHVIEPGFFTRVLALFASGYFPCGWAGEWPAGQLVVF